MSSDGKIQKLHYIYYKSRLNIQMSSCPFLPQFQILNLFDKHYSSPIMFDSFYKISRNYLSQKLSFLLCLPLILVFGFTKDPDFLHYSSELVSTLIVIFSYVMYLQYQKGKNFFFYIPCLLLSLILIF